MLFGDGKDDSFTACSYDGLRFVGIATITNRLMMIVSGGVLILIISYHS